MRIVIIALATFGLWIAAADDVDARCRGGRLGRFRHRGGASCGAAAAYGGAAYGGCASGMCR